VVAGGLVSPTCIEIDLQAGLSLGTGPDQLSGSGKAKIQWFIDNFGEMDDPGVKNMAEQTKAVLQEMN
jgi:hypothetical protein